jgi:hypothetical protein
MSNSDKAEIENAQSSNKNSSEVDETAPYLSVVKATHPDVDIETYQVAPAHAKDIAVDNIVEAADGEIDTAEIKIETAEIDSEEVVEIAKEHL